MAANPLSMPVSIADALPGTKKPLHADLTLVPDALFGIEYPGKTYRFFALEADRATMPCRRSDLLQSSYLRKLLAYRAIAAQRMYKSRLGLPNLLVLTVTTSEEHMRSIMALLNELTGSNATFLFKAKPDFGDVMRAPWPRPELLSDPWLRVGHDPMNISV